MGTTDKIAAKLSVSTSEASLTTSAVLLPPTPKTTGNLLSLIFKICSITCFFQVWIE